ncbi:MAG: hypothetical protein BKP49_05665 [Treponema sp. CETP13]|nr:MAG: hypothetical protein BKP49_05665 [Treponema sp. CETP13]
MFRQKPKKNIRSGTDSIVFNADSGEVEYRFTTDTSAMADLAFLSDQTALTRMNLESIKTQCTKLAFDVDDSSNGALQISLPSNLFEESDGITRQSTTVLFDTTTETLNKVEIVTVDTDMTEVTTSTYPVYDDSTGTPIKVGLVTEVVSKATKMIDGINPDEMEWFESPEDIPEMSDSEYEELKASGCIEEISDMTFGNPADPSYTETIAEVYEDVKINAVSDETFKLLIEE